MRAFPWPNMCSRIQMNSRNKDNPKIDQQQTILRQMERLGELAYQGDSAVLTMGDWKMTHLVGRRPFMDR
jgi:hypothetical protein